MSLQALCHITSIDNLTSIIQQGALLTQQEQIIATGKVKSGKVASLQTVSERRLPPSMIYRGLLPHVEEGLRVVSSVYMSPLYTDTLKLVPNECAIVFPLNLLYERKDWRVGAFNSYGHSISGNPEDDEYDYRNYYQFAKIQGYEYMYEICFHSFVPLRDSIMIAVPETNTRTVRNELRRYHLQNLVRAFTPFREFKFTPIYKNVSWRGVEPTSLLRIPSRKWYREHYKTSLVSVAELKKRQADGELIQ